MAGGFGYTVQAPMYIPQEQPAGKYVPEKKELPGIIDSSITGIRLANSAIKALPRTPVVDSGTKSRAIAAAERARDISAAFSVLGARQAARGRAIARLKDKRSDRIIKENNKAGIKRRKRSQSYNVKSRNKYAKYFAERMGMDPDTY